MMSTTAAADQADTAGTVRHRPRMVMIVDNQVVGDSRVIKSAMSAVKAGYETVIVGRAFSDGREETCVDGARLIRIPVPFERFAYVRNRPRRGVTAPLAFRGRVDHAHARRMQQARLADRKAQIAGLKHDIALSGGLVKHMKQLQLAWIRVELASRSRLFRLRAAQFQRAMRKAKESTGLYYDARARVLRWLAPSRFWRSVHPLHLDYEMAYGPVVDSLTPDLIHAHDFRAIGVAVRAKWRAEAAGRRVGVIYDAHEHVPGLVRDAEFVLSNDAYVAEYIKHVDGVVTVSPILAKELQRHYSLSTLPSVVMNTPLAEVKPTWPRPSIRQRIGVGDGIPLVVHSGSVAPERGLDLVIKALPQIPDLHFAIVTGERNALAQSYLDIAERIGVADRVHLARYVPHEQVVDYLAPATLACIPMTTHTEKHHVAAPTKFYEYLHSRLPMVVSDARVVADNVRRLGVGEVFRYDEPDAIVAAIRAVLTDLPKYQSRLADADAARREYSWEYQSKALRDAWESVSESSCALQPTDITRPLGLLAGRAGGPRQASVWARELRRQHPGITAEALILGEHNGSADEAVLRVSVDEFVRPSWQTDFLASANGRYSHVLVQGGRPLLPALTHDLAAGLSLLERNALHVGLVFDGSEVRDPELHQKLNPSSPFPRLRAGGFGDYVDALGDGARLRRDVALWFGDPIFVSKLDLLDHVDRASWLPISVDTERWRADRPALDRVRPIVLHVPLNELLVGSEIIDSVLFHLAEEGIIEYRRASNVAYEDMPNLIASADIVVDQLQLCRYGALACEAMATGRLVLSEVGQRVRGRIPVEIPIVEVNGYTLEERLRQIVADPPFFRRVAEAGPRYVTRFHDGRFAARVLARWMGIATPDELEQLAQEDPCHT